MVKVMEPANMLIPPIEVISLPAKVTLPVPAKNSKFAGAESVNVPNTEISSTAVSVITMLPKALYPVGKEQPVITGSVGTVMVTPANELLKQAEPTKMIAIHTVLKPAKYFPVLMRLKGWNNCE